MAVALSAGQLHAQSPATPPRPATRPTPPAAQVAAPSAPAAQAPPSPAPPTFTPEEQKLRQEVLDSEPWQAARRRFELWLMVQSAYDDAEVENVKRGLAARIAAMPAAQLREFLVQMQQKLDVLMSPDVSDARRWADEFYTPQGQRDLLKKQGAADPVDMTADQLVAALNGFARDREQRGAAQASFQQGLEAQASATTERIKAQRAAADAAAAAPARQSYGGAAPNAPKLQERPQRYQAPYDPVNYGFDPWGGLWIGW
jgi:hypothetical protein